MAEKIVDTGVDYKCMNKYCYVYKANQNIPIDRSPECHNCNMTMKKVKNV